MDKHGEDMPEIRHWKESGRTVKGENAGEDQGH
jgi:hypothetical protein